MGAFLGLLAGLGLLLIWHGLTAQPSAPSDPGPLVPHPRAPHPGRAAVGVTPAQLIALQVLAALAGRRPRARPHPVVQRLGDLRRLRRRGAAPGGRPPPAQAASRSARTLARGGRQPHLRRAGRFVAAGGPVRDRRPRSGTAARAVPQFGSDYRTTGRFNDSLDRLKDALADPVGDRVCESLRVAREVGGTDLGRLLSTLSGFLRDDARTRAELLARQSWSVNAARMAVAAPWLVLILLATQRETLQAYDTPTGHRHSRRRARRCPFVAYRLMIRIGRLPEDRRVLR